MTPAPGPRRRRWGPREERQGSSSALAAYIRGSPWLWASGLLLPLSFAAGRYSKGAGPPADVPQADVPQADVLPEDAAAVDAAEAIWQAPLQVLRKQYRLDKRLATRVVGSGTLIALLALYDWLMHDDREQEKSGEGQKQSGEGQKEM